MIGSDLCGLVVPSGEDTAKKTMEFFSKLTKSPNVNADVCGLPYKKKRWVKDFLTEAVHRRLEGSLRHLGDLFEGECAQMFQPDVVDTNLGKTSWAALTYLAVLHSHDCWHMRWHHDFQSANTAWTSLEQKLGEDAARLVCAMIAFQNTLRSVLHESRSCEVRIVNDNGEFCNNTECLAEVKGVIETALGDAPPALFWRSCAYAALALQGRRQKSSDDTTTSDRELVKKIETTSTAPADTRAVVSFEYGNYVEDHLCECQNTIIKRIDPASDGEKICFYSVSLGRHWRKSDWSKLSEEICHDRFAMLDDNAVSLSWAKCPSKKFWFHHIKLGKAFRFWLDARICKPRGAGDRSLSPGPKSGEKNER